MKQIVQTINKTELCTAFGFVSQGNRPNVKKLRKSYLTDAALINIGIDPIFFDKTRKYTFDAIKTHKLRVFFIEKHSFDILQTAIK